MNVLVLGSGGREHAIAWKLHGSPLLDKLYCAPGNPGTAAFAQNLPVNLSSFEEIKTLVLQHQINMVIVGPEEPLVRGIADYFSTDKELLHCFLLGPSAKGAQLEGSKEFAKAFMQRQGIPTAAYASFTADQVGEAVEYLTQRNAPYVLKADGLAAGKGVLILNNLEEAQQEVRAILGGKFGSAGNRVVIEDFLQGIELSVFFLTDGESYKILPEAKDYKRIGAGDMGLNTGGMGAVSPVPFANAAFMQKVEERIIWPTVTGLRAEEIDYKGFVFVGLMNCNGDPYVIEYNVRMGDPETEVVMPRIEGDLLALFTALFKGELAQAPLQTTEKTALCVVGVSGGYPEVYTKGYPIEGLESVQEVLAFHAGTAMQGEQVVTSGGRVFACTALADTLQQARVGAYDAMEKIHFKDLYYRPDIGMDLMNL